MTDQDEIIRERSVAVLDFLADLYALKNVPVRSVHGNGFFSVTDEGFEGIEGLIFGGGDTDGLGPWVRHVLVPQVNPPELPRAFNSWIEARWDPTDRPVLVAVSAEGDAVPAEIASSFDEWLRATWNPWEARHRVISRSRSLYRELFELRTLLQQSGDTIEVRLGFWNLVWGTGGQRYDHPVLSAAIEIEYRDRDGSLTLNVVGGLELEYELFGEVDLADREGMVSIRRTLESALLSPWEADDDLRSEAERVGRAMHHDTRVFDRGAGADWAGPSLRQGWVVFARKKPTDYKGFVEGLRDAYRDGAEIPTTFASVVVEEPSRLPFESGGTWDPPGGRPLLPLPANAEQYRILERINQANGVTAQGPPGTGKSHTIANLISHFVAVGKRVLVVAEKEQALSVLLDKVPADIRDLCVSVIGTDTASKARIEHSIRAIYDGAYALDQDVAQREIARYVDELSSIDEKLSGLEASISDAVAAEGGQDPVTGKSPSAMAKWLRSEESRLSDVPDRIAPDATRPMSTVEAIELKQLAGQIDVADRRAALQSLPSEGDLPSADSLVARSNRRAELTANLESVADWVPGAAASPRAVDELVKLASDLQAVVPGREAATQVPWIAQVEHQLRDPGFAAGWASFKADVESQRASVIELGTRLRGSLVQLPDSGPLTPAQLVLVQQTRARFASGKGFGRFGHKDERDLVERLRVAGHPPSSVEQLDLCILESERRQRASHLRALWNDQVHQVGGPIVTDAEDPTIALQDPLQWLDWVLAWPTTTAELEARLRGVGWTQGLDRKAEGLRHAASVVRTLAAANEVAEIAGFFDELTGVLADGSHASADASPIWRDLEHAVTAGDFDAYRSLRSEVGRLRQLAPAAQRLNELDRRLRGPLPLYAELLVDGDIDPALFEEAWDWRRAETWLDGIRAKAGAGELQAEVVELTKQRQRIVERTVATSAWHQLSLQFTDAKRQALTEWIDAHKKFGKGTGKHAARWQAVAKQAMDRAKEAVPVWVMPVNTVIRSFKPGSTPPFDVLIIDEASQCGLFSLPLLALARKAIVVGDDKQTSPENVGFNREPVHHLIDEHLRDLPNRQTLFDLDTSLYDVAGQKFPGVVMLREHFRCLPEIIDYSSKAFYSGKIECLRDRPPAPGWTAVESVLVPEGQKRKRDDANEAEAEVIVSRIEKLTLDPSYDDMSIGVVTLLGKGQAKLIDGLLLDRLGPQLVEDRQIRCGDPAAFQGDERDVVFLSVVAATDGDGGRIGAMTGLPAQRRINVAASRARNQMIVVHSVPAEAFPAGDPRAELIRHCSAAASSDIVLDGIEDRCENAFERDVLREVLKRGYERVRVQHRVGSYRIDFVIEGDDGRLAVECDGEGWAGEERWAIDRAHQRVLERVGWRFVRIRGSAFYRDPESTLEPLWAELRSAGVLTAEEEDRADLAAPLSPKTTVADEFDTVTRPVIGAGEASVSRDVEPMGLGGPVPFSDVGRRQGDGRDPGDGWSEASIDDGRSPGAGDVVGVAPNPASVDDDPGELAFDEAEVDSTSEEEAPESSPPGRITEPVVAVRSSTASDGVDLETPAPQRSSPAPPRGGSGTRQPYRPWPTRPVVHVESADASDVADVLIEIVEAEGPIVARRAYQLYNHGGGGKRLGKNMKSAFNRALRVALSTKKIALVDDIEEGYIDKTLFVTGSSPVVVRELGPRDFYEVPRSEICDLARQLGYADLFTGEAKRAVLDAYGLKRLTTGVTEYLDGCEAFRIHTLIDELETESPASAVVALVESAVSPEPVAADEDADRTGAVASTDGRHDFDEILSVIDDRCPDSESVLLVLNLLQSFATAGWQVSLRPSARSEDGYSDSLLVRAGGAHVATVVLSAPKVDLRLSMAEVGSTTYARSMGNRTRFGFAVEVPLVDEQAADEALLLIRRAAHGG